eukprot:jgi/Botrbrau1/17960/Bobra.50_1s0052.1
MANPGQGRRRRGGGAGQQERGRRGSPPAPGAGGSPQGGFRGERGGGRASQSPREMRGGGGRHGEEQDYRGAAISPDVEAGAQPAGRGRAPQGGGRVSQRQEVHHGNPRGSSRGSGQGAGQRGRGRCGTPPAPGAGGSPQGGFRGERGGGRASQSPREMRGGGGRHGEEQDYRGAAISPDVEAGAQPAGRGRAPQGGGRVSQRQEVHHGNPRGSSRGSGQGAGQRGRGRCGTPPAPGAGGSPQGGFRGERGGGRASQSPREMRGGGGRHGEEQDCRAAAISPDVEAGAQPAGSSEQYLESQTAFKNIKIGRDRVQQETEAERFPNVATRKERSEVSAQDFIIANTFPVVVGTQLKLQKYSVRVQRGGSPPPRGHGGPLKGLPEDLVRYLTGEVAKREKIKSGCWASDGTNALYITGVGENHRLPNPCEHKVTDKENKKFSISVQYEAELTYSPTRIFMLGNPRATEDPALQSRPITEMTPKSVLEYTKALEAAVRTKAWGEGFRPIGRGLYKKTAEAVPLPGGVQLLRGISLQIRVNVKSIGLVVDATSMAVLPPGVALEWAKTLAGTMTSEESTWTDFLAGKLPSDVHAKLSQAFQGVKMWTVTDPKREYVLKGLSDDTAATHTFQLRSQEGDQTITVADYFAEKKGTSLKWPGAYCAKAESASGEILLPLEVLEIHPRTRANNLTADQRQAMLENGAQEPSKLKELIETSLEDLMSVAKNDVLQNFKIQIKDTMVVVPCSVMEAPPVLYSSKTQGQGKVTVTAANGTWNVPKNAKFLEAARVESFAVAAFVSLDRGGLEVFWLCSARSACRIQQTWILRHMQLPASSGGKSSVHATAVLDSVLSGLLILPAKAAAKSVATVLQIRRTQTLVCWGRSCCPKISRKAFCGGWPYC